MSAPLSEGAWIDRFAMELGRLGAALEADLLTDLGREIWPFVGDMNPEDVARADWEGGAPQDLCSVTTVY